MEQAIYLENHGERVMRRAKALANENPDLMRFDNGILTIFDCEELLLEVIRSWLLRVGDDSATVELHIARLLDEEL